MRPRAVAESVRLGLAFSRKVSCTQSMNAFGMTDLVVALTLGALTGFQLINVTPSGAPISVNEAEILKPQLAAIGVDLAITTATSNSAGTRRPRAARG